MALGDAIAHYAPQECLITHDRVFGLLGITSAHFEPDYAMPLLELYLRALNEGIYVGPIDVKA